MLNYHSDSLEKTETTFIGMALLHLLSPVVMSCLLFFLFLFLMPKINLLNINSSIIPLLIFISRECYYDNCCPPFGFIKKMKQRHPKRAKTKGKWMRTPQKITQTFHPQPNISGQVHIKQNLWSFRHLCT